MQFIKQQIDSVEVSAGFNKDSIINKWDEWERRWTIRKSYLVPSPKIFTLRRKGTISEAA